MKCVLCGWITGDFRFVALNADTGSLLQGLASDLFGRFGTFAAQAFLGPWKDKRYPVCGKCAGRRGGGATTQGRLVEALRKKLAARDY